jgi:ketosteroid isomerase-like protein
VSYLSARPEFTYLLNTHRFNSRDEVRIAFADMLSSQARFEPTWQHRHVQILSADIAVFVGEFETMAIETDGTEWQARGVVTFVAHREPLGWRVVQWHTTERTH